MKVSNLVVEQFFLYIGLVKRKFDFVQTKFYQ